MDEPNIRLVGIATLACVAILSIGGLVMLAVNGQPADAWLHSTASAAIGAIVGLLAARNISKPQ